jgi:hypothetical protein
MPLSKKTYSERKAKGLCVQCGKTTGSILGATSNGKVRCDGCLLGNKNARRTRRAGRKKTGTCTECPNKAMPDCSLCEACSKIRSESSTQRYYANKEAGTCRFCGAKTENNESRCPKHKQQLKEWRERQKQQKILED